MAPIACCATTFAAAVADCTAAAFRRTMRPYTLLSAATSGTATTASEPRCGEDQNRYAVMPITRTSDSTDHLPPPPTRGAGAGRRAERLWLCARAGRPR